VDAMAVQEYPRLTQGETEASEDGHIVTMGAVLTPMDFRPWYNGTVVGHFHLDLFLQNPENSRLRYPRLIASQLFHDWHVQLTTLIPLASQSMISPPLTLPQLVQDRKIENASLINKLTNALVYILRV
jgi:hypothetical protein